MKKWFSTKPEPSPCAALKNRMRVVIAAANFSPAVASRRVKYDGDFRVQTLLGAKPLDHTV
jgi:hypothetical protein